ncbi:hypothetical protein OOK36_34080 [Streptomyces sp. NBC_00365]|uniref:hypothetical protein n=1 Tax=Streptomyces sp. NBC_00365 TaxID=2975726 RepID=UPI002256A9FB|nr:hypothetical protein [Streptomyces sp. NBC_00365]MCX5093829.1 hypothetical protein [Streptomyces sp. NBC_00365]
MTWQGEHHDAVLAEILLSEKVGVAHVRHVGDLISVRAQLSMGMQGTVGLSFDQRAEITEAVLELEDAYRLAWSAMAGEPDIDRRIPKLAHLEHVLEAAVAGVREIARQNGIRVD